MNSNPTLLNESELLAVNGGVSLPTLCATGGFIWFLLEVPHVIMGLREFTNYTFERLEHGCEHDENDHFTNLICKLVPSS